MTTGNTANPYVIDLFGWGTVKEPGYANNDNSKYLGSNCTWSDNKVTMAGEFDSSDDWGIVAAKDVAALNGSRTLTNAEWTGLLQNQCWALVNLSTTNGGSVFGLVVFPYGMTANEITVNNKYMTGTMTENTTSADNLTIGSMTEAQLNASGALFLPSGGFYWQDLTAANGAGSYGVYWSASAPSDSDYAYYMQFYKCSAIKVGFTTNNRCMGRSVCLAKDVTE